MIDGERAGAIARWSKGLSIGAGVGAAFLWLKSASIPLPEAPGAAIGGTSPSDPFNVALHWSATLNQWAAGATGVAVLLMAVAEGLPMVVAWFNRKTDS